MFLLHYLPLPWKAKKINLLGLVWGVMLIVLVLTQKSSGSFICFKF